MSTFVLMYHPLLPATADSPVWVALKSVDEHEAKGWLQVDPEAPSPPAATPYFTREAADSRFAKVADIDDAETATGLALRAASVAAGRGVYEAVEHVSRQALPLADVSVAARAGAPIPCGAFDGYMWGTSDANPATLSRSSDGGATWTTAASGVPVAGIASGIQRILPTSDGEVLAFGSGNVVRSAGWGTGSLTWSTVLTNPTTSYFFPWSCDGDGDKFIVTHYASVAQGFLNSRYGWISTDQGRTFQQVWDTEARVGSTVSALTHIHAAAYDPWEDRFFICEGHDVATGVFVSDDDGGTWTRLPYGTSFTAPGPGNSPTVCVPTDQGVVFGSDSAQNGVYVLPRGADSIEYAWTWRGISNTQLLGYAHQGFRDPDTGVVYITYVSDELDLPAPVAASDGRTAQEVWIEPGVHGMWRRIAIDDGQICMWEQTGDQVARGKLGGVGQIPGHRHDTGRVLGGTVTGGRSSLAVGKSSVAIGNGSIAVGGGAATTDNEGTAVGADAKSIGTGQSLGHEATSDAGGTAVGYRSSTANGTAVGNTAKATHATATAVGRNARAVTDADGATINSTAIGRDAKANNATGSATAVGYAATASAARSTVLGSGATASHADAVALGQGTTTTAASQAQLGARHVELTELASDPAAPAANGARWFVRDNGSGKTQLCVRFATGAIIVIATEP